MSVVVETQQSNQLTTGSTKEFIFLTHRHKEIGGIEKPPLASTTEERKRILGEMLVVATSNGIYYSNSQKVDRNFPAYNKKSREILTLIDQRQ